MQNTENKSENSANKLSFWKRAWILALGFGLGGLLWGLEAYRGTVGSDEVFTNPFSYILGAVTLGVFGGLALAYLSQNKPANRLAGLFASRQTWKIVGLGILGWLVGFTISGVLSGGFLILGGVIQPVLFLFSYSNINLTNLLNLAPSMIITGFWFGFLITGAIIGLVYSVIIKTKILRTILWGAGGFAVAALIGPILGNLIGNLFGSLFVSYLVTFLTIGVIFGLSLSFSIKK